jgi:hypothetical protein
VPRRARARVARVARVDEQQIVSSHGRGQGSARHRWVSLLGGSLCLQRSGCGLPTPRARGSGPPGAGRG